MKIIQLKTLHEVCGGCPTHYRGETVHGEHFDAYLRHGYMSVTLDGEKIVSANPMDLDGVCSFSDFKKEARKRGYYLQDEDAEQTSYIDEMEDMMQELMKDRVYVEFIRDFDSKSQKMVYEKGKRYDFKISTAELLVEKGYAVIDDQTYEEKKAN